MSPIVGLKAFSYVSKDTQTVDILTAIGVNITSPTSGEVLNTDTVTMEWTGIEVPDIITSYAVRLYNGTWHQVGKSTSYTFNNVADGQHLVTVKGINVVGNEVEMSVTFNVRTSAGGEGGADGVPIVLIIGVSVAVAMAAVAIYFLKIRKDESTEEQKSLTLCLSPRAPRPYLFYLPLLSPRRTKNGTNFIFKHQTRFSCLAVVCIMF
ncbi:MAG: hypothetical protein GWO20_00415 [Candidatus Korarchaeota archaeon]|nr:hypothetical protein [Candidatus Korarchaeota archaeon]NIU82040.1 hypothetical protein [Candidatus Thorarchaeota archaeon]NIW12459.1 hypothetical protein [Candidatus Thorarchaeota archaeon]NIW50674.1 hypothetical protein [Candidatus Korarchaeota archaeon]